eukprot:scaffold167_cov140-Skeletonema_menzelii.AAC.5
MAVLSKLASNPDPNANADAPASPGIEIVHRTEEEDVEAASSADSFSDNGSDRYNDASSYHAAASAKKQGTSNWNNIRTGTTGAVAALCAVIALWVSSKMTLGAPATYADVAKAKASGSKTPKAGKGGKATKVSNPSSAPTQSPSEGPSDLPSASPSASPSALPTASPSCAWKVGVKYCYSVTPPIYFELSLCPDESREFFDVVGEIGIIATPIELVWTSSSSDTQFDGAGYSFQLNQDGTATVTNNAGNSFDVSTNNCGNL